MTPNASVGPCREYVCTISHDYAVDLGELMSLRESTSSPSPSTAFRSEAVHFHSRYSPRLYCTVYL